MLMNHEQCLQLIELYKSREFLWNPKNKNYFNRKKREAAWKKISSQLNFPISTLKVKMRALLGSYRSERSKENKSRVAESSEVYKSRWFAYESLGFLGKGRLTTNKNDKSDGNGETQIQNEEIGEEGSRKRLHQPPTQNDESFSDPNPTKRAKTEDTSSEGSDMMTSALQLLQAAAAMLAPSPEDDEVAAFFKYVTTKVRTFPPETRRTVQKAVFDILMKADKGVIERVPENDDSTTVPSPPQLSRVSICLDEL